MIRARRQPENFNSMKTQSKNKKSSARRTAKGVGSGRLVRPFWRVEGVPATAIESFATRHGLQMVVRERRKPIGAPDRYYASFENVEVMNPPGFLLSTFGDGATPEEAVAAYAEEISMKRIAIGAYTSERREIEVPRLSA